MLITRHTTYYARTCLRNKRDVCARCSKMIWNKPEREATRWQKSLRATVQNGFAQQSVRRLRTDLVDFAFYLMEYFKQRPFLIYGSGLIMN